MFRVKIDYHKALKKGLKPITYILINTKLGFRIYSFKGISQEFESGPYYADGTYIADGTITAGSGINIIDKSSKLLSLGRFDRTISPRKRGLLFGFTSKQRQTVSVDLDNEDSYFSKLLGKEPFLGSDFRIFTGFEGVDFYQHVKMLVGIITEVFISSKKLTLRVEED
ncbi:hypothetical protein LCGC14_0458940 [marine sediment metagenome]|uniref:Uncharacterized protein n=1 Tax=marine sediment metagenome TaxID=412755 RepID=A0A0F9V2K8_9ZZZZ